jgi:protoheme ferro-lyase
VRESARYLTVLVKKNSQQHTSVQWQSDTSACEWLGPLVAGCPLLRDSIDHAVRDGTIEVPSDD